MTLKCKNPYFDENIDRKFVFLLYSVLIAKGINLGEKFDGLFISDDKVGILETHLDYEMAVLKEVSVYEAFEHCIPEGMRYNKELDKLVPDIIEHCFNDNSDVWNNMIDNFNIISKSLEKKEIINERENGFIKADLEKLDFSLVDPFAYSDLAFQLTVGAKKYSKDNWKKGDINIYLSALERHIQDIKKALDEDDIEKLIDDTGIQHGGALLCNSMFIHYFIRQILKDKNVK